MRGPAFGSKNLRGNGREKGKMTALYSDAQGMVQNYFASPTIPDLGYAWSADNVFHAADEAAHDTNGAAEWLMGNVPESSVCSGRNTFRFYNDVGLDKWKRGYRSTPLPTAPIAKGGC